MGRAPGSWRCAGAFVFDYSYLISYYHNVHPDNHKEGKVQEEERLSLREAADALGVSEVTARRWIKSGKLKAHQPGRKYLIPRSAVDELLESESPKAPSRSSLEPSLFNGLEDERRDYGFQAARDGLDNFNEHWQRRLSKRDLDRQAFNDLGATVETWVPILTTALAAEWNEIAATGDRFDDSSVIWPAVERFLRLGEDLAKAEREMYGDDMEAEKRRGSFEVLEGMRNTA